MIREQQRFSQDRLSLAMWDLLIQIRPRIFHQADHFAQVFLKLLNTFLPSRFVRRPGRLRPIAFGKFRRNMFGVAAEFQDIPLRQPRVLEELPSRMRKPLGIGSALTDRKSLQCVHEVYVRPAALEQIHQMFPESSIPPPSFLLFRALPFFLQASSLPLGHQHVLWYFRHGCGVVFSNPALANIFSYSENV
jgi:hypothetical protein